MKEVIPSQLEEQIFQKTDSVIIQKEFSGKFKTVQIFLGFVLNNPY